MDSSHQTDLHWPLQSFEQPQSAAGFFRRFNGAFIVYSKTVRKLYGDYQAELVSSGEPKLIIQPDFKDFTSMFHNIESDAVLRTSVLLFEDKGRLILSGVMAHNQNRQSFRLREGLHRLFSGHFVDGAFLPVLTYGDLRTIPGQTRPMLQLHGLRTESMHYLSAFQVQDIVETIKNNLLTRLAQR